MKYSDDSAINAVYTSSLSCPKPTIRSRLVWISDGDQRGAVELGEDRSWASVWWAYGALHHELSDGALAMALELLVRVDRSADARAAALMLQAAIKVAQAAYAESDSPPVELEALGVVDST